MAESAKQRAKRRRQREEEARVVVEDVQQDRLQSDNKVAIVVIAVAAVVAVAAHLLFASMPGNSPTDQPFANPTEVPNPELSEYREWSGSLTINDSLTLDITISGDKAPQAAANFIALARGGFYDDTTCHRLTTEGLFVLQCGDPTGTGSGGPGYEFGPLENVPDDEIYPAGTIAMARTADPNSMGSQFFIVYDDTQLPSPGYTVLGQVTGGLDGFKEQIVAPGVQPGGMSPGDGPPVQSASITAITLE